MSFADLYTSGEHRRNLAHFAALATLASVDGEISTEERKMLDRFATKLDITKSEYEEVFKKENKYPIDSTPDSEDWSVYMTYLELFILIMKLMTKKEF